MNALNLEAIFVTIFVCIFIAFVLYGLVQRKGYTEQEQRQKNSEMLFKALILAQFRYGEKLYSEDVVVMLKTNSYGEIILSLQETIVYLKMLVIEGKLVEDVTELEIKGKVYPVIKYYRPTS